MKAYLKNIDDWTNERRVGLEHGAKLRQHTSNTDIYGPGVDIPDTYKVMIFDWIDQIATRWCKDIIIKKTVMNLSKVMICSYSINDKVHMTSLLGIVLVILRMVIKIVDDNHSLITNHDIAHMTGHVYTYKQINMFECHVLRYTSIIMKIMTNTSECEM